MLKKLAVLLVTILTMTLVPAANAETTIFNAYSLDNSTYPSAINPQHRLFIISVSVVDANPSELILRAGFKSALTNTSFQTNGYSRPQLRFVISNFPFSQRSDVGEFWLEAPTDAPYQGTTHIPAIASTYSSLTQGASGGRKSLTECKPETWLEAGAQTSAIAFKIDRVCAEIPNIFYVNAYIDSDNYNSSTVNDWKFATSDPTYIDMSRVPRPPKMINQTVTFGSSIGTQNLDNPVVTTTIRSSMGLPINVSSLTPSVCTPSIQNSDLTVKLNSAGTCTLDAYAIGNSAVNPSPHIQQSFLVQPKVMLNQEFYWTEPDMVQVGDDPFDLFIYSSSHLDVTVTSLSPGVCQFRDPSNPSVVTPVGEGDCIVSVSQAGNDKYYARLGDEATFWIDAAPVVTPTSKPSPPPSRSTGSSGGSGGGPSTRKLGGTATASAAPSVKVPQKAGVGNLADDGSLKVTIKCKKGLLTKTVTGSKKKMPTCPTGYKKVK